MGKGVSEWNRDESRVVGRGRELNIGAIERGFSVGWVPLLGVVDEGVEWRGDGSNIPSETNDGEQRTGGTFDGKRMMNVDGSEERQGRGEHQEMTSSKTPDP